MSQEDPPSSTPPSGTPASQPVPVASRAPVPVSPNTSWPSPPLPGAFAPVVPMPTASRAPQDNWPAPPPGHWQPGPPYGVPPSMQYNTYGRPRRPALLTTVGVLSIVFACISILAALGSSLKVGAYYAMHQTLGSSTASGGIVPTPATMPALAVNPGGLSGSARQTIADTLKRANRLDATRSAQLAALLDESGNQIFSGDGSAITSTNLLAAMKARGRLPAAEPGKKPADYFDLVDNGTLIKLPGRLELYDDHAVFHPDDGGDAIRAMSTPDDDGLVAAGPSTLPAGTVPTPPPGGMGYGPMSSAGINLIVQKAQTLTSNTLTPLQVASLRAQLASPTQALVNPALPAAPQLSFATRTPGNGFATFTFIQAGIIMDAQGQVTGNFSTTGPMNPIASMIPDVSKTALGLTLGDSAVEILLAIYLFICGVFVLRDSPRGRKLHTIYSCIAIPVLISGAIIGGWVAMQMTNASMANVGIPAGRMQTEAMVANISTGARALFWLAYPVTLLFLLRLGSINRFYHPPVE